MFCKNCAAQISDQALTCPKCGEPTGISTASPKSKVTAILLCLFLGCVGAHRFYVGKVGSGIAQIFTLGGLGFWALYDLVIIICNKFTDSNGQIVSK